MSTAATTTPQPRTGPATVVGRGVLAEHLTRRLDPDTTPGPGEASRLARPGAATVLVAGLDGLGEFQDTVVDCLATGRPLLFVGVWRSLVYIGPVWRPGAQGCPRCLVTRTANSPFGPGLEGDSLAESWPHGSDVRIWGARCAAPRRGVRACPTRRLPRTRRAGRRPGHRPRRRRRHGRAADPAAGLRLPQLRQPPRGHRARAHPGRRPP
ncbi:hypothetical protein GCM10020256_30300 [Streptomyces thermocoprophilus]